MKSIDQKLDMKNIFNPHMSTDQTMYSRSIKWIIILSERTEISDITNNYKGIY